MSPPQSPLAEWVVGRSIHQVARSSGLPGSQRLFSSFYHWPLADVLLVFLSSMQMFRRITEIYGSRSGVVASWALSRKVLAQLVVAGALSKLGRWVNATVGQGQGFLYLARPIGKVSPILTCWSSLAWLQWSYAVPCRSTLVNTLRLCY